MVPNQQTTSTNQITPLLQGERQNQLTFDAPNSVVDDQISAVPED